MKTLDELIDDRAQSRISRNYKLSDEIRNELDKHLIFVFDAPWGQEVHYLTEAYFKKKPESMNNRQYVEYIIQRDSRAERNFQGFINSMK